MVFISSCGFKLPSGVTSFQPEVLPLAFLKGRPAREFADTFFLSGNIFNLPSSFESWFSRTWSSPIYFWSNLLFLLTPPTDVGFSLSIQIKPAPTSGEAAGFHSQHHLGSTTKLVVWGMLKHPQARPPQTPTACTKVQQFLMNKCFLIYHLCLIFSQSPEMIGFENFF